MAQSGDVDSLHPRCHRHHPSDSGGDYQLCSLFFTLSFINYIVLRPTMPSGLKPTSGVVIISGNVTETAADTFTQQQVDLQLDVLNREVFVLVAVDLNMSLPDSDVANNETITRGSLSTTSRTSVGTIANTNVYAAGRIVALNDVNANMPAGIIQDSSAETPHAQLEYIGIIATNDFFAQIKGDGNTRIKGMDYRVWGYRAQASADVFAALTQSELLSA